MLQFLGKHVKYILEKLTMILILARNTLCLCI